VSAPDEAAVVLYPGQSFAHAIGTLMQLAEPGMRVAHALLLPIPLLSVELAYGEDTDWRAAAHELAEAAGMALRQIEWASGPPVWVLAYAGGGGWFK